LKKLKADARFRMEIVDFEPYLGGNEYVKTGTTDLII